ncbi:MAG: Xanthine dehydrogenase, molybdenum binding subunit apoprotein [Sporomusa sp.]|nr:Xanthine dehydrogenase, molybdenum binding subunit apoprotein [Sporomusa sp.]
MELNYVGKNVQRTDAVSKVTGALPYANDMVMAGMLHGKLLRSEYAHARILSISTTKAKEVPGVVAVITARDLPKPVPRYGPVFSDQPILADGEVRYHGEVIAVVLAVSEESAKNAVHQIKVEYEALPFVCTIEDALQENAPLVHAGGNGQNCSSNVHSVTSYGWGDVDAAKKECRHIIENAYSFPMINHVAIEPYCVIAYLQDGGVTVQSPVQHPFILRRVIATALGLVQSKVRIIPTAIGGGFGGKGYSKYEPLAAYLALLTGKPIKLSFTIEDSFFTARRLSNNVKITTGFDGSGHIVFQDVRADYLMGAYADAAPRIVAKAGYLGCGPYRTPNARIAAKAIYSNTVPATAMRGFGMPPIVWAIESQMNEASQLLGIDSLAIRLLNIPEKGETLVPGDTPVDGNWKQGLQLAANMIGWTNDKEENTGRGIAIGIKNPIPAAVSNAIVKLHADDSLTVSVGTTEMGQGARTVMAQIAAEALGLPVEQITVIMGDTAAVAFDLSTAGSRSTVSMGNAVELACQDLLDQIKAMAHELNLNDEGEEVNASGGVITGCRLAISYPDLLKMYLGVNQGEIIGKGTFKGTKDLEHPLGGLTDFWEMIFTAAEVKVDAETGKVEVTKLVNVSDVGKAINPLQAKAQEEGASIMALGHTLFEQLIFDSQGRLKNGGLIDYRIPTAMDIPHDMKSAFIENQDGSGPHGAKGLGESGVISPTAAIAEAVRDAVGVKIKDLPLTPEKVWRAIRKQEELNAGAQKP